MVVIKMAIDGGDANNMVVILTIIIMIFVAFVYLLNNYLYIKYCFCV